MLRSVLGSHDIYNCLQYRTVLEEIFAILFWLEPPRLQRRVYINVPALSKSVLLFSLGLCANYRSQDLSPTVPCPFVPGTQIST